MKEDGWIKSEVSLLNKTEKPVLIMIKNDNNLDELFLEYSEKFLKCANLSVNNLRGYSHDNSKVDSWIFPIIYLYRQSLELLIKGILLKELSVNECKVIFKENKHDIEAYLEILFENIDKDKCNNMWLTTFVKDLTEIDKDSDVFRYPMNRKMKAYFKDTTRISYDAIYENFNQSISRIKHLINEEDIHLKPSKYYPKLFIDSHEFSAYIGWRGNQTEHSPYVNSYKKLAEEMLNELDNETKMELFLPICYLLRNSLELSLKRIFIEQSDNEYDFIEKKIQRNGHSLLKMWNLLAREIDERNNSSVIVDGEYLPSSTIDSVREYIEVIHNWDVNSDKFRYPCDMNLNKYFINEEVIDLMNISNIFIELLGFLSGVDAMLEHQNEMMAEMLSDIYCYD